MGSHQKTVIIVGSGVFGASTALHLAQRHPSWTVTLMDRTPFPCPRAASHDINKIVRAAYSDLFYCRLAVEAQKAWRTDPLFHQFYHEDGHLSIYPSDSSGAGKILDNFCKLGINPNAEVLTPEQVRQRFNGQFLHSNLAEVREILWNPHSGWAEAASALAAAIQAAIDNGVRYVVGTVRKVLVTSGRCTGVLTEDGPTHTADQVILCTGAETARILADSTTTETRDLPASHRFTCGAIVEAKVKLTASQLEKFNGSPSVLFDANITRGETMPPTPDGYLKFTRDIPVGHTVLHPPTNSKIPMPPPGPEATEWTDPHNLPATLRDEISTVIRGIYGPDLAQHLQPSSLRLCWDGLSPDEDWYITPHPHSPQSLYIATIGSWHAWKFLPTVGRYVVDMLDGTGWADPEMRRRWAWDRDIVPSADEDAIPRRELGDLLGRDEAGGGAPSSRI